MRNPLDFIRDDLALRLFTRENSVRLFEGVDITGDYFLMAFVSLGLEIRNLIMTDNTRRLGFLQAAFSVSFRVANNCPTTGKALEIYENSSQAWHRKTLWTKRRCQREWSLCIAPYWAITTDPSDLGLG
jgi:hypothetical protein